MTPDGQMYFLRTENAVNGWLEEPSITEIHFIQAKVKLDVRYKEISPLLKQAIAIIIHRVQGGTLS